MGRAYSVREASIKKTGAAKAKLYSNYAKEIYLIAKKGSSNPESNLPLKRIIDKARKEEVPTDIINRAIEKAKGSNESALEEVTYEGFGPGSSTLIIKCLTDNLNRTVSFVRAAFNKVNKSIGVTNSVSYNYDHLGICSFISDKEEEIFEKLLAEGIEIIDIENNNKKITIYSHPNDFNKVKDVLEQIIPNIDYIYDEVGMFPKEQVMLNEEDMIIFKKLYDLLEEIDDVVNIYHNVNMN